MPQARPVPSPRPAALFVFSNLREQKGGLTRAFLRRLAVFDEAGWDTHVATIHLQPEIDGTLAAWRARGWLPRETLVHHYQRRDKGFRPSWSRATEGDFSRDNRIAEWLDWLVGPLPGAVVFADSPVTYAPVALMRNPFVGRIMTVHLGHRPKGGGRGKRANRRRERSRYQGPVGQPKLVTRFLPYAGRADAVVALTGRQAEHLREDLPGVPVHVIPNLLDIPANADPVDRDRNLFVQMGRLDPVKRIDHSIRALARAVAEVPDLRLAVYGRGPDLDDLVRLRDDLGLQQAVSFPGFTEDSLGVLASARGSLMTSKREGFGLAVAESLSVGTPVISYDIDYGPSELISDGQNGRLVPDGSVEEIATAMIALVRDDELWARLSAAGPAAVAQLRPEVVGSQWLELAERVRDGVEIPAGAVLVEDLRVDAQGLRIEGIQARPGSAQGAPRLVWGDSLVVQLDVATPGPAPTGLMPARAVSGRLAWESLPGIPLGEPLQALSERGELLECRAPGVTVTSVPTLQGPVVLTPQGSGALLRISPADAITITISPRSVRARVGDDETVVTGMDVMSASFECVRGNAAIVACRPRFPGTTLDPDSRIVVVGGEGVQARRLGLIIFDDTIDCTDLAASVSVGRLVWDKGALASIQGPEPMVLSVATGDVEGGGRPLEYGASGAAAIREAGRRWRFEATPEGGAALVSGRALVGTEMRRRAGGLIRRIRR